MIAEHEDLEDDDELNPVDVLADEFSERLREGENPSITEYVIRHPDLEADIRELFPTIAMMEQFRKKQQDDTQLSQVSARLDAKRLKQLGDFRVIREVGRGGMGVVYAAEQQSLKRFVALKVLAPSISGSENELRRFKREAEAAARLHHTNIVPVFGTGESDGLHFIVMQLVDGVPLNEAIDSVRAGVNSTVRAGRTEVAHSDESSDEGSSTSDSFTPDMAASALLTGSTQRPTAASVAATLKLSPTTRAPRTKNLLAAPSTAAYRRPTDSSDVLSGTILSGSLQTPPAEPHRKVTRKLGRRYWDSVAGIAAEIADALAYAHDQGVVHRDVKPSNLLFDRAGGVWITDFGLARHEDQEAVTRTGDIIGTLRYMAPEQCIGAGDSRSDIYSLGLTLYELLTLQPAFPESRHAILIRQKHDGTFPKPRSLDRNIPRDLETVTLKACSTDPAHRYQTAAELAADLRSFIEDRPVRARQITPVERLWRWSRRNPTMAALSSLSLGLLVAVAVVFAIGNYQTGLALNDAERERKTADSERITAEIERNRALAAAEKARQEEEHARSEGERAEANLQIAVRAFEEIISNIASRGIPQSMTFASAEDTGEDGAPADPPASSSDAVVTQADAELLESLLRFFDKFASRNSADLQVQSAAARRIIGDIHQRLGRLDDAAASYREALAIVETLVKADPENTSLILEQARIINDLGVTLSRRGEFREPFELHLKARQLIIESEELMSTTEGRFALAEAHNLLGSIGSRTGVNSLYAALSDEGTFRPPGRRRPETPRGENTTNPDRSPPGSNPRPPGNSETTRPGPATTVQIPSTSGAAQQAEGGAPRTENRSRPPSRFRAPRSQVSLILESYDQAISLLTGLIDQEPSSGRFRLALAQCFRNRMTFSRMVGHRQLERKSLEEAILYLDALTTDFPNVPVYQFELADTLCLNVTRPEGERDAEYEFRVRRAVTICRNLIAAYPTYAEYRALMSTSLSRLAAIHRAGGDIDAARATWKEALELQRVLASEHESVSSYQTVYASTLLALAGLEDTDGTREAATEVRRLLATHLSRQLEAGENGLYRRMLIGVQQRIESDTDTES
ncbi:MAG: serine/threonine-protein kinase [Planctomycetota bacterium]|nr:serine/threonine-protein kinase [Planctomycetota bacterium]MDA1250340.1 serine/threonine-protein kinase [Planctomycetota bacterium]